MLAAARYLSTTELFKQHNVVLSEEWNTSVGVGGSVDFIVNPNDKPGHEKGDIVKDKPSDDNNWSDLIENIEEFLKDLDNWDENKNDLPVNPGSLDTLDV